MVVQIPWEGANFLGGGEVAVLCAETSEPVDMSFGMKTWVGPRNYYVLEGGRDLPMERGVRPIGKHCNTELCNNC